MCSTVQSTAVSASAAALLRCAGALSAFLERLHIGVEQSNADQKASRSCECSLVHVCCREWLEASSLE